MTKEDIIQKTKTALELRGRNESTIRAYTDVVKAYQDYHGKPADQMGEEEIAEYLHYLLTKKKLSSNSVNGHNTALRFLYAETMDVSLDLRKIPEIKRKRSFPQLLTKEEIQKVFNCTKNLQYKAMFMLAYGSGLRLSEIINLRVCDIDSKQMRIFVSKGKGGKDRYTLLPQTTLEVLREYWRECRTRNWLFVRKDSDERHHKRTVQDSFKRSVQRAGIDKKVTIHTLRHCFTTHLLNEGQDLYAISKLLGHSRLDTTSWYIHLTDSHTLRVQSPLDTMREKSDA